MPKSRSNRVAEAVYGLQKAAVAYQDLSAGHTSGCECRLCVNAVVLGMKVEELTEELDATQAKAFEKYTLQMAGK